MKKNRSYKQIGAVLVTAALLFGLAAVPALAEGSEIQPDIAPVSSSETSVETSEISLSQSLSASDSIAPSSEGSSSLSQASLPEVSVSSESLPQSTDASKADSSVPQLAPDPSAQGAPLLFSAPTELANAAITSMSLKVNGAEKNPGDSISIDSDSVIELTYQWAMTGNDTDTINQNDWVVLGTITKSLPFVQNLAALKPIEIVSADESGTSHRVGSITFADAGAEWKVILTYDQQVRGLNEVSGFFSLSTKVDFSQIKVPGDTVDFGTGASSGFHFVYTGELGEAVKKTFLRATYGADKDTDQYYRYDSLVWQIDVNTALKQEVDGTVKDIINNTSGILDAIFPADYASRIKVYRLDVTQDPKSGAVVVSQGQQLSLGTDYTLGSPQNNTAAANPSLEIFLGTQTSGKISEAYRIIVEGQLALSQGMAGSEGAGAVAYNTAYFAGENSQANTRRSTFLQGKKTGALESTQLVDGFYRVKWNLYINRSLLDYGKLASSSGGQATGTNVPVGDLLPSGMTFDTSKPWSWQAITYDPVTGAAGLNATQSTFAFDAGGDGGNLGTPVFSQGDDTNGYGRVDFTIGDLNGKGYCLTVYAKVKPEDVEKFNLSGRTNNMSYTVDGVNYIRSYTLGLVGGGKLPMSVTKTAVGQPDVDGGTMAWEMVYNTGTTTARDLVMGDTFSYNSGSSMKLITGNAAKPLVVKLNDTPLAEGTDYAITGNGTSGFTITFKGAAATFTGKITVSYYTEFKRSKDANDPEVEYGGKFINYVSAAAYMGGSAAKTTVSANASQTIPDKNRMLGAKTGTFSSEDAINWVISLNTSKVALGETLTVTDVFGPSQGFSGDVAALKVYREGDATSELLAPHTDYSILESPAGSTTGFKIAIKNAGSHSYRLEYSTYVSDPNFPLTEYTNTAYVKPTSSSKEYQFSAVVSHPGQKAVLDKSVVKDGDDNTLLHYTLSLNEGKSTVINGVLRDKLSRGLILKWDTVQVSLMKADGTTVDRVLQESTDGGLTGDYVLRSAPDVDDLHTEVTVRFINSLKTPGFNTRVVVTYDAEIDVQSAKKDPAKPGYYQVSNAARLEGTGVLSWKTVETSSFVTTSSGGAHGIEMAFLRIRKVDDQSNVGLADAQFQLLKKSDRTVVKESIVTDVNGWSPNYQLPRGEYILVEVQPPSGYQAPSDSEKERDVDLRSGLQDIEVTVANTKIPASSSSSSEPPASSSSSSQPPASSSSSSEPPASSSSSSEPPAPSSSSSEPPASSVSQPPPASSAPVVVPSVVSSSSSTSRVPAGPVVSSAAPSGGRTTDTPGLGSGPAVAPDPTAAQPELPVLEGSILPNETGQGLDNLALGGVPMGGLSEGKAWSLLNLIMSLFALFSAILLLVTLVHRREESGAQDGDDFLEGLDQEAYGQQSAAHRLIVLRIPAIIMGVVPGILFLTLENIRLPLTWITQWTPLIGAFFIIDMVLVLIHYVVKKREKSDGHENDEKVKMKKIAH